MYVYVNSDDVRVNTLTNLDELPCLELEDFKCEEEFDLCFLLFDDRCSSRSRRLFLHEQV